MKPVSKYHPLKHYTWGSQCDGWNLVDEVSLSVKHERMPSGAAEARHYHEKASQFFFILKGQARFEVEDEVVDVGNGEGLQIASGKKHRILNPGDEDLEFILCSQPSTVNDRVNCE